MRQPLYGNMLLTNELGLQWGTESRSNMRRWAEKGVHALKDIARANGQGWCTIQEIARLGRSRVTPNLYARLVNSIPWEATPMPLHPKGLWVAEQEEDGNIQVVYHL